MKVKVLKNKENRKINLVSIPIGNLDDITIRAINTLKNSDYVFCENTKTTSSLFSKLGIRARLSSFHKHNEVEKSKEIIDLINQDKIISVVSDAGTPLISDPGTFAAKFFVENDIMLYPIPGVSSLSTTMSVNIFNSSEISFVGFVDKREKEKLKKIITGEKDYVCFISPHYLESILEKLHEDDKDRNIIICKELTKLHETHIYGSVSEILENIRSLNIKGEFTMIVQKKRLENDFLFLEKKIRSLIEENLKDKEILSSLTILFPRIKKNEIKQRIINERKKNERK